MPIMMIEAWKPAPVIPLRLSCRLNCVVDSSFFPPSGLEAAQTDKSALIGGNEGIRAHHLLPFVKEHNRCENRGSKSTATGREGARN